MARLLLLLLLAGREGRGEDVCPCTAYTEDMQTVVVKNTWGNLGNKMFTYVTVQLLRTHFQMDAYITENVAVHLAQFFTGVGEVPVAERRLCGLASFMRQYKREQELQIHRAMAELKQQRQQTSSFLGPEQVYTNVSLGNSEAVFGLRVAVPESALAHSSFPWQEYTQRPVSDLWAPEERRGKAYIFFPVGMTNNALDDTFGEDIGVTMDDVPGLLDFTRRAFTFRPEYQEGSQALIARARQEYRRRHGKRKKVTFVGIHNRRGDHMDFQAEAEFKSMAPSYFLEAMDLFRERFRRVVFLYVSDEPTWGRDHLLPRVKTGDLYIVNDLLAPSDPMAEPAKAQGRDLAVLAGCNHTILSYGTYGFWGGFLAGQGHGLRVTPAFFPAYRTRGQTSRHYYDHPLDSRLPRFYYGMKLLR